jgi:hypothetical protein
VGDVPPVVQQLGEQVTQCRDLGARGQQRELGLAVHRHPFTDRPPLGVVAVQQTGGRPALDHSRQLPAEVDRVLQAEVESRSADHEVHVGGVADQQHPALSIPVRQAGMDADRTIQSMRSLALGRPQRQVHAHDAVDAAVELLERQGRVGVDPAGRPLDGEHQIRPGRNPRVGEDSLAGAVVHR